MHCQPKQNVNTASFARILIQMNGRQSNFVGLIQLFTLKVTCQLIGSHHYTGPLNPVKANHVLTTPKLVLYMQAHYKVNNIICMMSIANIYYTTFSRCRRSYVFLVKLTNKLQDIRRISCPPNLLCINLLVPQPW